MQSSSRGSKESSCDPTAAGRIAPARPCSPDTARRTQDADRCGLHARNCNRHSSIGVAPAAGGISIPDGGIATPATGISHAPQDRLHAACRISQRTSGSGATAFCITHSPGLILHAARWIGDAGGGIAPQSGRVSAPTSGISTRAGSTRDDGRAVLKSTTPIHSSSEPDETGEGTFFADRLRLGAPARARKKNVQQPTNGHLGIGFWDLHPGN